MSGKSRGDGNRRHHKPLSTSKAYIFRVHRDENNDVLLEPFMEDSPEIHLDPGDEFITGTLSVDPWRGKQFRIRPKQEGESNE